MTAYAIEKDREFGYLRTIPQPGMTVAARREIAGNRPRSRAAVLDAIENLAGRMSGRPLLDIGCKDGDFLDLCRNRGIDCAGWENISNWAQNAAQKGHRILAADLDEILQATPRKYGIVALFDVLQYLEQPAKALLQIRKNLLSDRGLLAVSVPNFAGPPGDLGECESRRASSDSVCNYFNAGSLTDLLEGCGFAVLDAVAHSTSMTPRDEDELVMFAKPDAYSKSCRATIVKNWRK